MKGIVQNIIGQQIKKVLYSEVNHHNGNFYFDGFDTFDHAINIQMKNGYWWNLGWKNDEYFEFGDGLFEKNEHIVSTEIKSWEATTRWNKVLSFAITDFKVFYIDKANFIPSQIKIKFENGDKVNILISEELNHDQSTPFTIDYAFSGEIYVFHDENLLHRFK